MRPSPSLADPELVASTRAESLHTAGLVSALEAIAARGQERGFVTSDDLLDMLPDEALTPEQIEEFLTRIEEHLKAEGTEVIELPEEDAHGEGEIRGSRAGRSQDLPETPTYDPVRMYLKDMGRVALLTAAQEVDLAMRIEAGKLADTFPVSAMGSKRVDQEQLRRLARAVVRIRDNQLDPQKGLLQEGMGLERLTRSYRPRSRAELAEFLLRN